MEREEIINIILLSGETGVGRTSIIYRIKNRVFQEEYKPTVGLDSYIIERIYERRKFKMILNFIEYSSEENIYQSIPEDFIIDSYIFLLVFSNIENLNKLKDRWYSFYKQYANIDNSTFILIGNKSDTFGDKREKIREQGEIFADDIDALFLTCSAKHYDNIDSIERFIMSQTRRFINEKLKLEENERFNLQEEITINKKNKGSKCILF